MKTQLQALITQALEQLKTDQYPDLTLPEQIKIDNTKDKKFGDFSSNIAMVLAKKIGLAPRDLAGLIIQNISDPSVLKTEIAGPGFINFYIDSNAQSQVIQQILAQQESFGRSDYGQNKKVQVEFVSANPTGPLHVGHGRGAAFGAAVSDLLEAIGYDVCREYYVNDAGRQMHILAASVWLRYLELLGEKITFPSNGYKGEYVIEIAQLLKAQYQNQDQFIFSAQTVFENIPLDEDPNYPDNGGNKDAHIDGLVQKAKELLGGENYSIIFDLAKNTVLSDIQEDLAEFRVNFQNWFSEQSLIDNKSLEIALDELKSKDLIYEQEGALWFKATTFGDDKDRVIRKENGELTYFANDIAYHVNKYARGFEYVIDIFGADHHGYVPRIQAMLKAFGHDISDYTALLVQFAILYRGKERVQMSTRSGSFVTLRELRNEVGNDAARFFYVMRKNEQHMDFDLELAKSKSNENPVYYVQYAHARICSVLRQLKEQNLEHNSKTGAENLSLLTQEHELVLINYLNRYSETLLQSGKNYAPHQLAGYLRELAGHFHAYYNAHKFLIEDELLRNARINLILATKTILNNGLRLLGVSSPESM